MISAKFAALSFFKIKIFWNESYDVMTSAHDVTNKILLRDSNYIVGAVMWLSSQNLDFIGIWQEKPFFEKCP